MDLLFLFSFFTLTLDDDFSAFTLAVEGVFSPLIFVEGVLSLGGFSLLIFGVPSLDVFSLLTFTESFGAFTFTEGVE